MLLYCSPMGGGGDSGSPSLSLPPLPPSLHPFFNKKEGEGVGICPEG